jgi:hypothetical protein
MFLLGHWRAFCVCALLPSFFAVAPLSRGQSRDSTEYEVKAAFLYNFAKFVEWPEGAFHGSDDALTFCVLGEDPFNGALDRAVSGKIIDGHPLRVSRPRQISDLRSCKILFLAASERKNLPQLLASLRGAPVLTVGDSEHFIQAGGMIGFLIDDNKVKFEINVRATGDARLSASSKLLALAKTVIGGGKRPMD